MRILVLGGYGLIGLAVSKRLISEGHDVLGLARSALKGKASLPDADWYAADLAKLTHSSDWLEILETVDVVINAAGVLQNGLKDNVQAVQCDAILALIDACEQQGIAKFIQISAPGVSETASTLFYRSKAVADQALKASVLEWTIFRPGLVLAPHAYGGTSLIRMLAAIPLVQPLVMADKQIQTVSIDDVTAAVAKAIVTDLSGKDIDLVGPTSHSLAELVLHIRAWLGFSKPKAIWRLPNWLGWLTGKVADLAGWLGWRSAMRSTAIQVITNGVTGNSEHWKSISRQPAKTLEQTLNELPSSIQERVYARAMLVFPMVLIVLAGFWLSSGIIGLFQHDRAVAVLDGAVPESTAHAFVWLGSVIDIIVGAALLFRPLVRMACLTSVIVSAGYLSASLIFTPHLWADPLGPMVKVIPAIGLALVVTALAQER